MKVCPACETKNDPKEKYCLNCGQKLIEDEDDTEIKEDKLTIPKDKIILLDLNYTLISNSWPIRYEKLPGKITKRKYEHELVDLIKDNYVILITANPTGTSTGVLRNSRDTGLKRLSFQPTETIQTDTLQSSPTKIQGQCMQSSASRQDRKAISYKRK